MRIKSFLAILLLFLFSNLNAQEQNLRVKDSLKRELLKFENNRKKEKALPNLKDSTASNLLMWLSQEYWDDDTSYAKIGMEYAKKALIIAEDIGYKKGMANAANSLAEFYKNLSDSANVVKYYNYSLNIRKSLGNNFRLAQSYISLGDFYNKHAEYLKAYEFYDSALYLVEYSPDSVFLSDCFNSLGVLYQHIGDYESSIKYLLSSLKIRETFKDTIRIAEVYNNIWSSYFALWQSNNQFRDELNQALKYYNKSISIYKTYSNKCLIAQLYNNIGVINSSLGDYDAALHYLKISLDLREQCGYKEGIVETYINICGVYLKDSDYVNALKYSELILRKSDTLTPKNYIADIKLKIGEINLQNLNVTNAISYFEAGLKIAKEINEGSEIKEAYKLLAKAYYKNGEFKLAYDNLDSLQRMNTINVAMIQAVKQIEDKHEFDRQLRLQKLERDLVSQEETRKMITQNVGIFCFIVFLFFLFLVFLFKKNTTYLNKDKYNVRLYKSFSVAINFTPNLRVFLIIFLLKLLLLFAFEFFYLLLHPFLENKFHSQYLLIISLVIIAAILSPRHHKLEKWIERKSW